MARSSRQSKILEIISSKEVETQEELAYELKKANFQTTQATISRDIKELGLTKILSSSGGYKYAIIGESANVPSSFLALFKECVISIKSLNNFILIKTVKGFASSVCSMVDRFNIKDLQGAVYGDDTVMLIFTSVSHANSALTTLNELKIG